MADTTPGAVPFGELETADLVVDRIYLGGSPQSMTGDPVGRLLPVGMLGASAQGAAERPVARGSDDQWRRTRLVGLSRYDSGDLPGSHPNRAFGCQEPDCCLAVFSAT